MFVCAFVQQLLLNDTQTQSEECPNVSGWKWDLNRGHKITTMDQRRRWKSIKFYPTNMNDSSVNRGDSQLRSRYRLSKVRSIRLLDNLLACEPFFGTKWSLNIRGRILVRANNLLTSCKLIKFFIVTLNKVHSVWNHHSCRRSRLEQGVRINEAEFGKAPFSSTGHC